MRDRPRFWRQRRALRLPRPDHRGRHFPVLLGQSLLHFWIASQDSSLSSSGERQDARCLNVGINKDDDFPEFTGTLVSAQGAGLGSEDHVEDLVTIAAPPSPH